MPNYPLEYSEEIPQVRPEEQRWLEEHLKRLERTGDAGFEWSFEEDPASGTSLWFHSDEQLSNALLELLQAFFAHFRPEQYLVIRYALTCSRPLVREFGGGRVFLAADQVVWSDLDAWERQQIERFQRSLQKEG